MTDIKIFDLNLLKALDALLVERSVTRAASRLNLSQPAVSGMLARLREAFADPLFVRGQRGIVPTERALQLAAPLRQALDELDSLFQPPFSTRRAPEAHGVLLRPIMRFTLLPCPVFHAFARLLQEYGFRSNPYPRSNWAHGSTMATSIWR